MRSRMLFIVGCVILVLSLAVANGFSANVARRPNLVFFMADDLGWGELGCYGQQKINTPRIDRLAAEGMRFTQAYSGSHVCAPSRSVLMTGLHSGHTPVRANGAGKHLYADDVTVAEVLKSAGYATGIFGKWGLGNETTPGRATLQGFDAFMGQLEQVHAHFYYPYWIWQNDKPYLMPENEGRRQQRYVHDEMFTGVMNFVREHRREPFFLYVPCIIPHVELVVPEESEVPYRGKFPKVAIPDPRPGYIGSEDGYTTFAGMIGRMDRDVGRLMDLIAELGLDDNTLFIFTSDNGGQGGAWKGMTDFFQGNGPLRGHKGSFHEGGIRVPLIARWPGHIAAGTSSNHQLCFQDVLPTLAAVAGVEPPKDLDGLTFLPTLIGKGEQQTHEFLYWEYPRGKGYEQAVRLDDWKLLKSPTGKIALYDLATDLGETQNIAKRHPEIVAKLERILATEHTPERDYPPARRPTIDDYVQ